jgi:hypothetical protein
VRYVRIIRAYHPLAGQIVKVLRQTRHGAYEERRWVVEPPGQAPLSLPLSWAILVDDTTDPAPCPVEPGADESPQRLVDVTSLLNLANIVEKLRSQQPQEVKSDEQRISADPSSPDGPTKASSDGTTASLEPSAPGAPPRADGDPGQPGPQPPDQAPAGGEKA